MARSTTIWFGAIKREYASRLFTPNEFTAGVIPARVKLSRTRRVSERKRYASVTQAENGSDARNVARFSN